MLRALLMLLVCTAAAAAQTKVSSGAPGGSSVSPCEDFFQYTCGAWIAANPIPQAEAAWGVSSQLRERNTETLRQILEAARAPEPDRSEIDREIGDYYQ